MFINRPAPHTFASATHTEGINSDSARHVLAAARLSLDQLFHSLLQLRCDLSVLLPLLLKCRRRVV